MPVTVYPVTSNTVLWQLNTGQTVTTETGQPLQIGISIGATNTFLQTETGQTVTTETGQPIQTGVTKTPGWVTITRYTPTIRITRIGAAMTNITAGTTLMFITQFIDGLSGLAVDPTTTNAQLITATGVVTALTMTPYTVVQPIGAYLIPVEFVEPGKNLIRVEGIGVVDVVTTHTVDVKPDPLLVSP